MKGEIAVKTGRRPARLAWLGRVGVFLSKHNRGRRGGRHRAPGAPPVAELRAAAAPASPLRQRRKRRSGARRLVRRLAAPLCVAHRRWGSPAGLGAAICRRGGGDSGRGVAAGRGGPGTGVGTPSRHRRGTAEALSRHLRGTGAASLTLRASEDRPSRRATRPVRCRPGR